MTNIPLITIKATFVFYMLLVAGIITNWVWVFKLLFSDVVLTANMIILIILSIFPLFAAIHGFIIWFAGWTFL